MAIFTLYFCGTDCWIDESFVDRSNSGGTAPRVYGPAGYIPTYLYRQQTANRDQHKAVMPGPGAPWYAAWKELWVPTTIKTKGGASRDTGTGESMWDLAGHAAARVVGVPSRGRGDYEQGDQAFQNLVRDVNRQIGAHVNSRDDPPSNDAYRWTPELLEVTLAARKSTMRGKVTTINLIGHSRGGVGAIMCTHELAYLFPNASVNVFAIDPVPGSGTLSPEMAKLGKTVRNYVGVYAIDEISSGFNGVVPQVWHGGRYVDPLQTVQANQRIDVPRYHLIYAPGRHGTVAGNATSDGKADPNKVHADTAAVGALVGRLASACLRGWGTDVPYVDLGDHDVTWYQNKMTSAADRYRGMRKFTYVPRSGSHWYERGITSSTSSNMSAWHYLEDAIGNQPLVDRELSVSFFGYRTVSRPNPGRVRWQAIEDIPSDVFRYGLWPNERL